MPGKLKRTLALLLPSEEKANGERQRAYTQWDRDIRDICWAQQHNSSSTRFRQRSHERDAGIGVASNVTHVLRRQVISCVFFGSIEHTREQQVEKHDTRRRR